MGFSQTVTLRVAVLGGVGKGLLADPAALGAGEDPGRNRQILPRHIAEGGESRVGVEGLPDLVRRVGPLDAAVETLGVLPEDHRVDPGLLDAAVGAAADEVQRVARKGDARPDRHIEIEALAQTDDGREVDVALVPELGARSRPPPCPWVSR